jgi:glycosyltransferase involved in cell wall biosynthesis
MSKTLLIGPRENKKDSTKTGGVIVLFEDLIGQFNKNNLDYIVVDTNKANYSNILVAMISIYLNIFIKSFKIERISLHGTANDYLYIAPFMILVSKLFRKKSSLRKFAGNFDGYYTNTSNFKKKIIQYVLKNSTYNFFETKYLVEFFKKFNENTFWFPNVREKQIVDSKKVFSKKFVFISQLYKSKGVDEILEASSMLDDGYEIDLYGPLRDIYTEEYFSKYKANYKGSLEPTKVIETLNNYDVLILASYYPAEGYPGVVIEALSLGKPVVVTDLESIKEMVDETCAVFVKPRSAEDIKKAILSFNIDNYESYAQGALIVFKNFDSDIQTKIFFDTLND